MKKPGPEKTPEKILSTPITRAKGKKQEARAEIYNSPLTEPLPSTQSRTTLDYSDLPSFYDVTRLVLMPRDPFLIFAYWEVSQSSIEQAEQSLGADFDKSRLVLRMYDVTCIDFNGENANNCFDIEVSGTASNWYIPLWRDNVSYCADLGFITPAGHFLQIARSNFTKTPPAHVSAKHDEIWMETRQSYQEPTAADKSSPAGSHGGDVTQSQTSPRVPGDRKNLSECDVRERYTHIMGKGQSKRKTPPDAAGKRVYLSENDIREYYANIYPLLRSTTTKQERFFRYDPPTGEQQPLSDPASTSGHLHGTLQKKIMTGASEELLFGGASERNFVSSAEGVPTSQQKDDFYFEIGTELIVYGRTRPDAEVWLEDKKILLHKDGTFSLRFALPDGKISLGFKAVSGNKQHLRKISTRVKRSPTDFSKK